MKITVLTFAALMLGTPLMSVNAQAPPPADPQMQAVLDQLKALKPKPIEKLTPAEARKQPNPTTAVLASQVSLTFAGTSVRQTLPTQTRSVRGGQTTGEIARFDLSADVPLTPSFVSDPTFLVRAFTLVNRTNGAPFERPSDFDPTSLRGGTLTLASIHFGHMLKH